VTCQMMKNLTKWNWGSLSLDRCYISIAATL